MQPWTEKIKVKQSVSVNVPAEKVVESKEVTVEPKKVNLKIAAMFSEQDGDVVDE